MRLVTEHLYVHSASRPQKPLLRNRCAHQHPSSFILSRPPGSQVLRKASVGTLQGGRLPAGRFPERPQANFSGGGLWEAASSLRPHPSPPSSSLPFPSPHRAGRGGARRAPRGGAAPPGGGGGGAGTRSSAPRGAARHGSAPGAMPLPCRGWTLALLTLLVGFLIFADISEIEEEEGSG